MISQRVARGALLALILAAPLVYIPRALLGAKTALPELPDPAPAHLVVVTVGSWPDLPGAFEHPALAAFDRRASRIATVFSPSPSHAAALASLWTGRHPASHGVSSDALALAEGTWTLAAAARDSGAATAALLQGRFASAQGIEGFDEVYEDPATDALDLGDRAAEFLMRSKRERVVLWVHLSAAGEGGRDLATLLTRLQQALEESDRSPEATLVLAVLDRGLAADTIDLLGSPLWVSLSGGLYVGRRSQAQLSLCDLTPTLRRFLGLGAPPAPESPHAAVLWNALRGGSGRPGVVVSGGPNVWRRGPERVVRDATGGAARAQAWSEGAWSDVEGERAAALLQQAAALAEKLARGRRPARPARPGD